MFVQQAQASAHQTCALSYLEEDVAKPSQEDNGPYKIEAVLSEGPANPETAWEEHDV
jgi:hypothetical protein